MSAMNMSLSGPTKYLKGQQGILYAHKLLEEHNMIGILIGGTLFDLYADSTYKNDNPSSDVDVIVLPKLEGSGARSVNKFKDDYEILELIGEPGIDFFFPEIDIEKGLFKKDPKGNYIFKNLNDGKLQVILDMEKLFQTIYNSKKNYNGLIIPDGSNAMSLFDDNFERNIYRKNYPQKLELYKNMNSIIDLPKALQSMAMEFTEGIIQTKK